MKISKLFHWLYAILMLLPFLVFLPNAFYYGFNEHAVAQEKTEQVPVYYESNEVNTIDDLYINHIYYFSNNVGILSTGSTKYLFTIKKTDNLGFIPNVQTADNIYIIIDTEGILKIRVIFSGVSTYIDISSQPFNFVIDSLNSGFSYTSEIINKISYTNYKIPTGEYKPLTTDMSITDSLSYAWDSVWQNDLFSWSYGSFLTEPFIYIGNVFNVPNDNSLYYALSYWLDISIIWLCFDVIMYVPLLVHRWLDKGIVE